MVVNYLDKQPADFEQQLRSLLEDKDALVALMGAGLMDQDFPYFDHVRCRLITLDYWQEELPYSGVSINNVESIRNADNDMIALG